MSSRSHSRHQAEQVVAEMVVGCGVQVRLVGLAREAGVAGKRLQLLRVAGLAAQGVDRTLLGGGHEPGARVVRHARRRPLLERDHERVLRQLLGQADVAHHPGEPGDDPGRLDPPDRFDRAMRIDGRHGEPSNHPWSADEGPSVQAFRRVARSPRGRTPATPRPRLPSLPQVPMQPQEAGGPLDGLLLCPHLYRA
jgi:hypothetical protein